MTVTVTRMLVAIAAPIRTAFMNLPELEASNTPTVRIYLGFSCDLMCTPVRREVVETLAEWACNLSDSHASGWHLHNKSVVCIDRLKLLPLT